MLKKGQVGVFVIIGVVLLILVALLWFLRSEVGVGVPPLDFLASKEEPLREHLRSCVDTALEDSLNLFAHQGGFFSSPSSLLYQGYQVPYYCQNIDGDARCLNHMPSLNLLEENLATLLQEKVQECVGETKGGFGYDVSDASLTVSVDSSEENLAVIINYPLVFSGKGVSLEFDPFHVSLDDFPLRSLYKVSNDIVNGHARDGYFYQLIYMLDYKGLYEIHVDKPFPHIVYKLNMKDSDFSFWFAVEGEA